MEVSVTVYSQGCRGRGGSDGVALGCHRPNAASLQREFRSLGADPKQTRRGSKLYRTTVGTQFDSETTHVPPEEESSVKTARTNLNEAPSPEDAS